MAQHIVKCIYCQMNFDTIKEPWVAVSARRYAHKTCYDKIQASKSQAERDYEELEKYIKDLYGLQVLTATIIKQIKTFKENYDYSYTGILKTLQWWTEVKKNRMEDKSWGIAIVPYVYDQAEDYYRGLYSAEQANAALDLEHWKPEVEVINMPPPEVYVQPPKLMEFWKERDEDEQQ